MIVTDVRHRQLVFFDIADDGLLSGAWHEEISRESKVSYFKPFAALAEENGFFLLALMTFATSTSAGLISYSIQIQR